jgi:hypothetical protein
VKLVHSLEEHLGNAGSGEWVSKPLKVCILRKENNHDKNIVETFIPQQTLNEI